jgi:hypothetical protein
VSLDDPTQTTVISTPRLSPLRALLLGKRRGPPRLPSLLVAAHRNHRLIQMGISTTLTLTTRLRRMEGSLAEAVAARVQDDRSLLAHPWTSATPSAAWTTCAIGWTCFRDSIFCSPFGCSCLTGACNKRFGVNSYRHREPSLEPVFAAPPVGCKGKTGKVSVLLPLEQQRLIRSCRKVMVLHASSAMLSHDSSRLLAPGPIANSNACFVRSIALLRRQWSGELFGCFLKAA